MTEIFLDTANINDIEKFLSWNIGKGITTNQKIFLKEKGCNFEKRAKEILEIAKGFPVSLEGPNKLSELIETAKEYQKWNYKNLVIKVPMLGNGDGLKAVKELSKLGIKTNVTACMNLNQAFLAASAGATYVSLFYNRMQDWKYEQLSKGLEKNIFVDSLKLNATRYSGQTIKNTMKMLENFDTKLIVGSIRSSTDIEEILTCEPDIITIPAKILEQMPFNEKTETTLKEFECAWEEFKRFESKG